MIQAVEQSYRDELSKLENAVFEVLPAMAQAAFRICRDLALRPTPPRPPLTFYLSSDELAARLLIHGRQAHRLLETFDGDIVRRLEKGQRWQSGVKPKASTYR